MNIRFSGAAEVKENLLKLAEASSNLYTQDAANLAEQRKQLAAEIVSDDAFESVFQQANQAIQHKGLLPPNQMPTSVADVFGKQKKLLVSLHGSMAGQSSLTVRIQTMIQALHQAVSRQFSSDPTRYRQAIPLLGNLKRAIEETV